MTSAERWLLLLSGWLLVLLCLRCCMGWQNWSLR
nr:MAG TPA: transmembrane protein [Caudoviricetes sp.]DAL60255.1 MAG TPA_asm: transmembrane protein [Caudoviricetes sp.]